MKISLRLCDRNDINTIYELANDPSVRENSFNSNTISYEEHYKWYIKSLADNNRIMFIAESDDGIIGQIRLDRHEDKAIISYSIEKNSRNKGYGKQILDLIKKEASLNGILKLEGLVKKNNIASRKAFIINGFIELEEDLYFRYIYSLK